MSFIQALVDKIASLFSTSAPTHPVVKCPCKTHAGPAADALVAKSPTLQSNISTLLKNGWTIDYGVAGKGSSCNRTLKQIVIDPNMKSDPMRITQALAHESGHALYTPDADTPPTGLTRQQYIDANVDSALKDEGEATLMNAQIRSEIMTNGGGDIGIAGAQSAKYARIAAQYPAAADRDTAREAIGQVFANNEHPSTDPSLTYAQYYAKSFADFFDKQAGGH